MTAEQWLADIEAKASKAINAKEQIERIVCGVNFALSADPAVVLRLVAMVRILAESVVNEMGTTAQDRYLMPENKDDMGYPVTDSKDEAVEAWITMSHQQTEPKP